MLPELMSGKIDAMTETERGDEIQAETHETEKESKGNTPGQMSVFDLLTP